ncbi:hypothetical protein Pelo_11936 [Pelomyxa schiedti]|nr:hypothetical protein Pelo_11936 [Pelomyxa schiedti]
MKGFSTQILALCWVVSEDCQQMIVFFLLADTLATEGLEESLLLPKVDTDLTTAAVPMTVDDAPTNTAPSTTVAAANNDNDSAIKCTSTTSKTDEEVLLQVKRSAPGPVQNTKRSVLLVVDVHLMALWL